jgi:hypothetical protein
MNEDEMAEYEERIQARVQEKWAEIEKKMEKFQKEYEHELEQIVEENCMMLFQEQNELKKQETDPDTLKRNLDELRLKMNTLKSQKLEEAKKKLEANKEMLNQEKKDFFKTIKGYREQINVMSPKVSSEVKFGNHSQARKKDSNAEMSPFKNYSEDKNDQDDPEVLR